MLITSWQFVGAVAVLLALYYALPRRCQPWLLLLASYALYASWSWHFPLVLLGLSLATYAIARRLWSSPGRAWLVAGIAVNVAALALLKYAAFYVPSMLRGLGLTPGADLAKIFAVLLPVGLSYRVLENISFLVDASRRQLDEFPGFPGFALYTAYFAKLLSGPIERGRAFLGQLAQPRIVDNAALARAFTLIILGAMRKFVLSDSIRGQLPKNLFADTQQVGWQLLFWVVADVFVVYNDFAGYTDMARGVSGLFGIELTRNFSVPFFSRNFRELWLRWHASLSLWLRDYIYLPASRALLRRGVRGNSPLNLVLPPVAAMLVSALWHEASWHMLAWGLMWGVFLLGERIPTLWGPVVPPDKLPAWRQRLGMVRVVLLLGLTNILFEMDLATAARFVRRALGVGHFGWAALSAAILIVVSLLVDWFQHHSRDEVVFCRWPLWLRSAALAIVMLALLLATQVNVATPFIYQHF
ncbi:MAG: hypothetical protein KBD01_00400 [Acidobacteria bacterium]|nr:hypothetical protein [Acidobacteriota bacterium]